MYYYNARWRGWFTHREIFFKKSAFFPGRGLKRLNLTYFHRHVRDNCPALALYLHCDPQGGDADGPGATARNATAINDNNIKHYT
jgi:hypothetical protein